MRASETDLYEPVFGGSAAASALSPYKALHAGKLNAHTLSHTVSHTYTHTHYA